MAWQVTSNNESYLRPLFSDFANDRRVWDTTDEFMFGRSILAAPVVEAQYTAEAVVKEDAMSGWDKKEAHDSGNLAKVDFKAQKTATKYLPSGAEWYDFWTGKRFKGGQKVTLQTQLDRVPMFVRAGSILPLGPEMQYTGEKSWEDLEIRIYPGADGTFVLYEDEGDNYNYEKGVFSTIAFQWNNKSQTLTIGNRQGTYPGMLESRHFTVVLPDGRQQRVAYGGSSVEVKF
jgi:alpha-D-xyloside xylohydrolase